MNPHPPESRPGCPAHFHDTYSAAGHGCICPKARISARRRAKHWKAGLIQSRKIDPRGTMRRVQALVALGWSYRQIGDEVGLNLTTIGKLAVNPRAYVLQSTADRIAALYDRLCMTPGTSIRSRNAARKNGWAPPLAWDDIDRDDHPVVTGLTDRCARRVELIQEMHDLGRSAFEIAAKLNVRPDTLERRAWYAGRPELARALHAQVQQHSRRATA